jgi:hypothetical protein
MQKKVWFGEGWVGGGGGKSEDKKLQSGLGVCIACMKFWVPFQHSKKKKERKKLERKWKQSRHFAQSGDITR